MSIKCVDSHHGFPFEYHFAPIIHRNTPLPASRSELFYTFHDNQTEVEIDVYQGESDDVRRNHRVGRFMVQGLSRVLSGNPIVVQLDLNLDGMLKVSARERATGLQKQVVIENALARFEREERDQARERLEQLWALPGSEDGYDDQELANGMGETEEEELPSLVPGPREGQREA